MFFGQFFPTIVPTSNQFLHCQQSILLQASKMFLCNPQFFFYFLPRMVSIAISIGPSVHVLSVLHNYREHAQVVVAELCKQRHLI